MKTLKQNIKNNKYEKLYMFCGEEEFLKDFYVKFFKKKFINNSINYEEFSGDKIDEKVVSNSINSTPFFDNKRLIVIKNSHFFKKKNEKFNFVLENIPESTIVIFLEKKVDSRLKIYNIIKKNGSIVKFDIQKKEELIKWIINVCKKNGKIINEILANRILNMCSYDMYTLWNELKKLITYVGDRKEITIKDIKNIITKNATDRIFEMIDYLIDKDKENFLLTYQDLIILNESYIKILYLINRHFDILLTLKKCTNYNRKEIASIIGVNPYFIDKYKMQANKFSYETLKKILNVLLDCDNDIKSGLLPEKIAVEKIILKIIN